MSSHSHQNFQSFNFDPVRCQLANDVRRRILKKYVYIYIYTYSFGKTISVHCEPKTSQIAEVKELPKVFNRIGP